MPVHKDPNGRRWVTNQTEVPGTPEEVWQAIATGPGISSWFVPTELEERVGGAATSNFGPGMDSRGEIVEWEPPRRFVARSPGFGDGPSVADEWTVEAKAGGTCVVRVVHSWFAETDDWDAQFEAIEHGWAGFFQLLRLRLAHFRGLPCAAFQAVGSAPEPAASAWAALTGALGVDAAPAVGARVASAPEAAPIGGTVQSNDPTETTELLVLSDRPGPGFVHLAAHPMGGMVVLWVRGYLFGEAGLAAAPAAEQTWQSWMASRFPMAAPVG